MHHTACGHTGYASEQEERLIGGIPINWIPKDISRFAANYMAGMARIEPDMWVPLFTENGSAALMRRRFAYDRFATVISGGALHGLLFPGLVWDGLADAAVVGGPGSAPNAYMLYETGLKLGREHGVLLLYNNYMGDHLNNDMAEELLVQDGIAVERIAVTDDIAAGAERSGRTGRCGLALLTKLAAACARRGMDLHAAADCVRHANDRLGTLNMQIDVDTDEVFFGRGTFGQPGLASAKAPDMRDAIGGAIDILFNELKPRPDEKPILLVNRLYPLPWSDCWQAAACAADRLEERQFEVVKVCTGDYLQNVDAYGCDITLLFADATLRDLMKETVRANGCSL